MQKKMLLHTDFPAPNWDQTTVVGNGTPGCPSSAPLPPNASA